MASAMVAGLGSPVARLACSDAQPSSCGFESQFAHACVLRSPLRLASSASGFAGFGRISVEGPGAVSPRRNEGSVCQAYARTATCDQTKEREAVGNPTTRSRIGGEQTLYDILGVTENAGVKEVKSAFRQLARRFHPDVNAEDQREECTHDFMKIHAAYTTLSDPQSKAAYDLQLSMQRFQRNGYAGGRVAPITENWDLTTDDPSERFAASEPTGCSSPTGYSAPRSFSSPSGYSAPSSFKSHWKGRTWETDQCW